VRRKLSIGAAGLAACGAFAMGGVAIAGGGPAATAVSIKVDGSDYHGFVASTKPNKCADDRKIVLYKKLGAHQNPQNDEKINTDRAEKQGDRYRWDTGNTGSNGKHYARAKKIEGCRADNSRTLKTE